MVKLLVCCATFCICSSLGAIYLKNVLTQSWQEKEVENPGDPVPFSVHEQDRQQIRDNVIEAIIHAAGPIR